MSNQSSIKQFMQGVMACIPTLFGYWAVGFACGAIGAVGGFSLLEIASLSIFVYAGSAQFLFYSLASTGSGLVQIALAIAFINMRYLLINAYMAQFFSRSNLLEKLLGGLLITDETFGVASQYAKQNSNILPFSWLLGLNLTAWLNWILATIVGALFASVLPDWLRDGLSFSLVGMFMGLLLLGWFVSQTRYLDIAIIMISMAIIVASHGIISSNLAMILATIVSATCGMIILFLSKSKSYE